MPDNENILTTNLEQEGDTESDIINSKDGDKPGLNNEREESLANSLIQMGVLNETDANSIDNYKKKYNTTFENAAFSLQKIRKSDLELATAKYYNYSILSKKDRRQYSKELITAFKPHSVQAEKFRSLRSRILLSTQGVDGLDKKCAFAVMSSDPKDGRSYLAANLAIVFGQLGKSTVLLDMNLRTPRIHEIFKISNTIGISDLFTGSTKFQEWWQIPFIPNLVVIPTGPVPPNPQELVSQSTFTLILENLYSVFDFVIIDTPPAYYFADAENIASRVKSALVLARKHHTNSKSLASLVNRLKANDVNVLGSVYNEY